MRDDKADKDGLSLNVPARRTAMRGEMGRLGLSRQRSVVVITEPYTSMFDGV